MTELYEDYNQFRRLHPLTLLYGLFRNLPYILITLYLGLVQKQTEELFYIFMLIFLGMVIIPGHILRWYYFSYMIGENEIIIRSGVFARKTRNIPIKRVQNINVKQDVLQRILGIARVQIETAGDISSEGSLDFVKLNEADEINKVIRLHKQKIIEKDNDIENIESNSDTVSRSETFNPTLSGDTLFSMSGKDVLVYGMVRLRPLFLIYGAWAASFLTQFKYVSNIVSGYIEETVDSFADLPIELLLPLSVAFLILTVVMSWIVDIVWTFLQYYGFK
ncbi:MAG: PH domain-containing protein, partial [Candidatus Kapabacteria bacterium]|nr:PH domain-containing protein [Candidatus Kapabacteria bacterium]